MSSLRELVGRIARLERDVRRISTQPQLGHSSIEDGAIAVYTDESLTMLLGSQFDGTTAPAVVGGPVPPTPFLPGVIAVPGGLTVVWSGLWEGDAITPMDFARVEIHASTDPDFEPSILTLRGTFSSPLGGEFFVPLTEEVEHYVALLARSESGKPSLVSAKAAGTPLPRGGDVVEESFTVTATGPQTLELADPPKAGVIELFWGPLSQPAATWSLSGQTITVADSGGDLEVGDTLRVRYPK